MSSGYLHKMEVRKSREVFRKALVLAKEFCRYWGALNICRERRQVVTQLRNEIMSLREDDLRHFTQSFELPSREWFKQLREELTAAEHPRSVYYLRHFPDNNYQDSDGAVMQVSDAEVEEQDDDLLKATSMISTK